MLPYDQYPRDVGRFHYSRIVAWSYRWIESLSPEARLLSRWMQTSRWQWKLEWISGEIPRLSASAKHRNHTFLQISSSISGMASFPLLYSTLDLSGRSPESKRNSARANRENTDETSEKWSHYPRAARRWLLLAVIIRTICIERWYTAHQCYSPILCIMRRMSRVTHQMGSFRIGTAAQFIPTQSACESEKASHSTEHSIALWI